jgi:DNA-binding CsgD family transcriptional regulator
MRTRDGITVTIGSFGSAHGERIVDRTCEPPRNERQVERDPYARWPREAAGVRQPPAPLFLTGLPWNRLIGALGLSKREAEIAWHIMHDRAVSETANRMGISSHTVQTHRERLYRKLHVRSRCQLVVRVFAAYVMLAERRHLGDPPTVGRATDAARADL